MKVAPPIPLSNPPCRERGPIRFAARVLLLSGVLALLALLWSPGAAAGQETIYEALEVRSPRPTVNHLTRLRYGAGKFLAVGEYATVISSETGTSWDAHPTGYTRSVSDIAFGNGVYVVTAADNATVLTSFDLETWEVLRPAGVPFNPGGILFHAGQFRLCGSDGTVASSADGMTWTAVDTGVDVTLRDLVFANGQFVCVGDNNTVLTSPDGVQWTLRPTGIPLTGLKEDLLSINWLNNLYVVGGKDGTILTSPNGTTWTLREYSEGNDWFWGAIHQGGAYYFTGRQGRLRRTTDFVDWDVVQTADAGDNDVYGVLTQEGITVVVGRSGSVTTSPNLMDWTSRKEGFEQSFSGLAFGAGRFVAADFDGVLRHSTDGVTWNDAFTVPGGVGLNDVIFADGKFVAVASGSEITQSPDGMLWSAPDKVFDGFPGVQGIRFLEGRWYVFGRDGLLRSSANLANWTTSDVQPPEDLADVTHANGTYVAVGANGSIYSSADGTDWDARTSGTTRNLNTVAYGNNRFVVAGSLDTVLTSVNGIDWTGAGVQFPPFNTNRLIFREGQFVALASSGQLGLSPDGLQWNILSLPIPLPLRQLAEGNERLVAVGNNGLILSTDPLPERTLTLTWTGDGVVSADPPGPTYRQGSVVTLTPIPGANHGFQSWGGDASGSQNPLTVVMDTDKTISATFQPSLAGFSLWQLSHFTAAERANPAISGPTANPDLDSRSNVFEYLGGSDPKAPDGEFATLTTTTIGNSRYPVISYVRSKGLADVAERVELSTNLSSWNYNGDGTGTNYTSLFNLIDGPGNDKETVSFRSLLPVNPDTSLFLRVRAEVQPVSALALIQLSTSDGRVEIYEEAEDTDESRGDAFAAALEDADTFISGAPGRTALVSLGPGRYALRRTAIFNEACAIVGSGPSQTVIYDSYSGSPTNGCLLLNKGFNATGYAGGSGVWLADFGVEIHRYNGIVLAHVSRGTVDNVHGAVLGTIGGNGSTFHFLDIVASDRVTVTRCHADLRFDDAGLQVDAAAPGAFAGWDGEAEIRLTTGADNSGCEEISIVNYTSETRGGSGRHIDIHRDNHHRITIQAAMLQGGMVGIDMDDDNAANGIEDVVVIGCQFRPSNANGVLVQMMGGTTSHLQRGTISNCHQFGGARLALFEYVTNVTFTGNNFQTTNPSGQLAYFQTTGNHALVSGNISRTSAQSDAAIEIDAAWDSVGIASTYLEAGGGTSVGIAAFGTNIWRYGVEVVNAGTDFTGNGWVPVPGATFPVELSFAVTDQSVDLAPGSAQLTFRMPYAMTLTEIRASVATAPDGGPIVVDLNEEGASVMEISKLSIDPGEKTSLTSAVPAAITDQVLADDAEITVDVDQVGSAVPGRGLRITLIGIRR